jgi:hypothetical protein
MANRPLPSQTEHNRLTRGRALELVRLGYQHVLADDIGWAGGCPTMYAGYTPDVTAIDPFGHSLIVEVETADSIYLEHTRRQWLAFSNAARRLGGVFEVLTPANAVAAAQAQAAIWGIHVDAWRYEQAA